MLYNFYMIMKLRVVLYVTFKTKFGPSKNDFGHFDADKNTGNLTFYWPQTEYRTKSSVLNDQMNFWNTQNIFKSSIQDYP